MKREDLRKIEGLSKEQIDAIMNLHQGDVNEWNSRSKAQSDDIKAKDDKINKLIAKVKEFDGVDVKQLQQSITDWESKYQKDLSAKLLGMKEVPCIRLDHMSDEQRKAYTLTHNQTNLSVDLI